MDHSVPVMGRFVLVVDRSVLGVNRAESDSRGLERSVAVVQHYLEQRDRR